MMRAATRSLAGAGAILAIAGFAAKAFDLPVPDWLACMSLTVGLVVVIFAGGRRSAAALSRR